MNEYENEDLAKALSILTTTIANCKKILPKFSECSSQHTLLQNRINALSISKSLILHTLYGETLAKYSIEELRSALPRLSSIISKCKKAQLKLGAGTTHHTRLENLIFAIQVSKSHIEHEIDLRL